MCFRCRSEDHFITNCLKLNFLDKKVHWNTKKLKTCAYRSTRVDKTSENSTNERKSQKIYTSMAHMSPNAEIPRINFGDSLQLVNYISTSGATYQMAPEISNFIPGLLVEANEYIGVVDGNFVTAKQSREV